MPDMLSQDSPLLNLPAALDKKQAVFLDGMRHAVQLVDFSYTRLCRELTELSLRNVQEPNSSGYTHLFLDAWAFVDAADRFRCLWEMQPNSEKIPDHYGPIAVRAQLKNVRDVRNVSAHVAQKIDQIVSLNASVLGSIKWVTAIKQSPLKVRTHFIRPGITRGNLKAQFAMPKGEVKFLNHTGDVSLAAGKHEANLSQAYEFVRELVKFIEATLNFSRTSAGSRSGLPTDVFGSAELDTSNS